MSDRTQAWRTEAAKMDKVARRMLALARDTNAASMDRYHAITAAYDATGAMVRLLMLAICAEHRRVAK